LWISLAQVRSGPQVAVAASARWAGASVVVEIFRVLGLAPGLDPPVAAENNKVWQGSVRLRR